MPVSANTHPTLPDVAKRLDPDGKIDSIVQLLHETNEIITDMVWAEGNLPTGHRTTVATGLPEPTWRMLYGGVQPTKGRTAQVTDNLGMLEAYAEVDKALADLNGNTAAFRMSEDAMHIEGMNQSFAKTLFYGSEAQNPERFTGLAPRFSSLSAENADNIIDAGGTGNDNTSIWLCLWGPNTGHGIYPKAGIGGLRMDDKGQVTIENVSGAASGGRMEAYRTHYRWDCGLTVRDWRYFVRIANLDVSALNNVDVSVSNSAAERIVRYMIQASERIPAFGAGRAAFYVNRNIREKLRLGILERTVNNLTWETVAGERVMMFDGIPVRRTDALLNTESRVV